MKVKNIIEATNGKLILGNEGEECGKFCRDTRIIEKGDTYIGIKGEHSDGNALWNEAFKNGATTVIVQNIHFSEEDKDIWKDRNIILVEDTIKAIADIATYKRNVFGERLAVVGITGSVGKTSTKDIVANNESKKYKTLKTEGNNNNHIGLPFTVLRLQDEEAAVIEMGMNHLGEITYLSNIAKPKIAVITNVGTSHIGNLGSRENILKAKLEILDGMEDKILVINNDNDLLHDYYLKNKNVKIYTYGIENQSEVMAENIELEENSSKFECNIEGKKLKINVPVGGIHFVYNALCAITVGRLLGLSLEQIKNGIETFKLTAKRMEINKLKNGVTIINDSYNASFESMQASLKYLSKLSGNRKIAVLGDMFELGEFAEKLHKKVGKEVANNDIDILICSGENAKFIVDAAKENGMKSENIYYFKDKIDIEEYIKNIWHDGDNILFKASNGMKFFEIVENLLK